MPSQPLITGELEHFRSHSTALCWKKILSHQLRPVAGPSQSLFCLAPPEEEETALEKLTLIHKLLRTR